MFKFPSARSTENHNFTVTEQRDCFGFFDHLFSKFSNVFNMKVVTLFSGFPELQRKSNSDVKRKRYTQFIDSDLRLNMQQQQKFEISYPKISIKPRICEF